MTHGRLAKVCLIPYLEHSSGVIDRQPHASDTYSIGGEQCVDINVRRRSQVQVIHLRGQLRMGPAVDSLNQTIEEAFGGGDTRIVVDLAEVPMIDSSGIGVLVRLLASAKRMGGSIKLVNPCEFVVRTLRLVGILNLFEVYDGEDAAVNSFS